MTRAFAILGITFLAAQGACSPGTSTVRMPDATNDDTARNNQLPDGSTPNNGRTDTDVEPGDDTGDTPDARVDPIDMPSDPDLGPPVPSRAWTAETDGTIAWWTFDPDDASLTMDGSIERGGTLNFLAFSADRTKLYAINQNRVEAFDITTEPPTFLGDADAGVPGNGTHLAVDATNSHVFVAFYGGDAVSMLPLGADGAPSDATVVLGGAGDPTYCERAHQIRIHPNNNFVYAPCLRSDHVVGLSYDAATGELAPIGSFATPAGAGPRHMDFHPSLNQAYVIGEQDDSVTRYGVTAATGQLAMLDTVSTLPNAADPIGPASDIHVSPNGAWLVGINRNPRNEVVTFAIAADGSLSNPTWVSTGGEHARTFAFSPRGGHLLVGNSNSQDVTTFTFDSGSATLVDTVTTFDANVFFVGFE